MTSLVLHLLAGAAVSTLDGAQSLTAVGTFRSAEAPMMWLDTPAAESAPSKTDPKPEDKPEAEPIPPPPPDPPKPREINLGVDDAKEHSETWLGSNKPGEHAAKLSTVEQPALTRDLPGGGSPQANPAPPTPPQPKLEPTPPTVTPPEATSQSQPKAEPEPQPQPAPAEQALPPRPPEPAAAQPEQPSLGAGHEQRPDEPAKGELPVEPAVKQARTESQAREGEDVEPQPKAERSPERPDPTEPGEGKDAKTVKEAKSAPDPALKPFDIAATGRFVRDFLAAVARAQAVASAPTPPSPAAPAAQPGPQGPGATKADTDAWLTEKVADATSLRRAAQYSNGTVTAGKGLELMVTKRPDSTTYTRLRGALRNPTFDIVFDRRGVPKQVIPFRSSGNDTLDFDIINAIHAWRAKGKDLQELSDRSEATLTVRLTFLLFAD